MNSGRTLICLTLAVLAALAATFLGAATLTAAPAEQASAASDPQAAGTEQAEQKEKTDGETAAGETSDTADEDVEEDGGYEWFTDATGKRYRIEQIPKGVEGRDFIWLGEDRIQIRYGMPFEVVAHDDETFSVRVYEVEPWQPHPETDDEMTEEKRAEILASYESTAAPADRLRFVEFDQGLPREGQWRNGFDIADMNGDGQLDIVFGPRRKGPPTPNIFLGDGKGGWQLWREARYPNVPFDYGAAAAADWNGDGHMDLALGIHLMGVVALVGDGKGKFELWSKGIEFDIPGQGGGANSFSSRAIAAVDWNGDSRPDILAVGEGPKGLLQVVRGASSTPPEPSRGKVVYLNNGDGTWIAQRQDGETIFGDDVAVGDFNADKRLDFATASGQRGNSQIVNLGDGQGGWTAQPVSQLRPRALVRAVASAHLDADRREDLVVGYSSHELDVWRTGIDVLHAGADGAWQRQTVYARDDKLGIFAVDAGDIDGDGALDLVALTGQGSVWVFLGDGSGGYALEESPELPQEKPDQICRGYGVRLVDLNGDGRDEVIAAFAGEGAGLPGIISLSGCAGEGSLRAWTAELSPAQ